MFKYYGLDACEMPREERGYWNEFKVLKDGKELISFRTNKDLQGMFSSEYPYRQLFGTCQFSMPGNRTSARRLLRRLAFKQIDENEWIEDAKESMAGLSCEELNKSFEFEELENK